MYFETNLDRPHEKRTLGQKTMSRQRVRGLLPTPLPSVEKKGMFPFYSWTLANGDFRGSGGRVSGDVGQDGLQ